jgi:hypothetical protein
MNMNARQTVWLMVIGGLLCSGVAGCSRDGPAERAGEKLDNAAADLQKGAEKAADKVEDAVAEVKDKVEDKK